MAGGGRLHRRALTGIDTIVLLAAGQGSRLRSASRSKPLCLAGGRTLIDHALERAAMAGLRRAIVVTGYLADELEAYLASRPWPLEVVTIRTADWLQPNGVSALAAVPLLHGAASLLAMCDHIVDPQLYRRLAATGGGAGLVLGIDRRLDHPWVDPDDVTRVKTGADGRITAIGKGLAHYDSHDTGVFAVGPAFFSALAMLAQPSVSQAVQWLADRGCAATVDCSDLDWLDVDEPKALAIAEQWLRHCRAA